MATDYIVRLQGKDNLSGTIKQVKTSLEDVGKSASNVDKIDAKFQKIIQSSAPLKRQLRDLQTIMAQMNMDGLSNTDQFTQIAQKAGEIKDAIADAADATKRFASDTAKLDAGIQAVQGIAGAASVATSAMALFGKENEDVQRAILKVQAALGILNGVQAVANVLNKDSALMQRIKSIRLAATTAATTGNTAATTANTVAEVANTTATVTNTAATKAWNVAKAVSKALLGDFSGLVLVGVAAMGAYAMATSKATDELDDQTTALKNAKDAQQNYNKVANDTYANLMTKYQQLRSEWGKLTSDHQRTQWIADNKSKFEELGLSINDVKSAENAFAGNTDSVVQSFIARAKAAARLAELTEEYRKQMELIDKISDTKQAIAADAARNGRHAKAGDEIKDDTYKNSRYGNANDGTWRFSEQGAKLYSGTDSSTNPQVKNLEGQLEQSQARTNKILESISQDIKPNLKGGGTTANTPRKTTTTGKQNDPAAQGSIRWYEEQIADIDKKLKETTDIHAAQELVLTKNMLTQELQGLKIDIGLEVPKQEKDKVKKVVVNELTTKRGAYGNAQKQANQIQTDYKIGLIGKDEALKQIAELNVKLEELGLKPITIDVMTEGLEKSKKQLEGFADLSGSVGDAFSGMGQIFTAVGDESAAAVMQMVATTAQGVAQVIPSIMSLIAAKEGEALASGTASASAMPFPANIAAIASIVATIIGTFASIISIAGSFANGGIVAGGSINGDHLLARVNSGEMILNGTQQRRLFDMLDGAGATGGSNGAAQITWKLKGADLYGSLSNFSKIKAKSGKFTGIK